MGASLNNLKAAIKADFNHSKQTLTLQMLLVCIELMYLNRHLTIFDLVKRKDLFSFQILIYWLSRSKTCFIAIALLPSNTLYLARRYTSS